MAEIPLYGKVEEVLASEIAQGELKPGDRLASEDELLARFEVSRITVRRAVQNLVRRGIVEIQRGRGTFVLAPKVSQDLTELTGFVEDMNAHGRKASARVLSQGVVAASAKVAEQLGLGKGKRVMRIERVRLADSVPMSFDETYLPLDIGKMIVRNDLRIKPIFTFGLSFRCFFTRTAFVTLGGSYTVIPYVAHMAVMKSLARSLRDA